MMSKLSIIIPIYNGEKYLVKTITSILKQNNGNFELILINDGSVDNSNIICCEFDKKYDFIKYYTQSNKGICATRNVGLKLAEGEYIVFVDQDDSIPDNYLDIIDRLIKDNECDLIIASKIYSEIDRFGKIINYRILQYPDCCIRDWKQKIEILLNTNNDMSSFHIWNCIYKLSFLKSKDVEFDTYFKKGYEDIFFNIEVLSMTNKIKMSSEILYEYKRNIATSTSKQINDNILFDNIYIIKKMYHVFTTNGLNNYNSDLLFYATRTWLSSLRLSRNNHNNYNDAFNKFWNIVTSVSYENSNQTIPIHINYLYDKYIRLIVFFIIRKRKNCVNILAYIYYHL